MRKNGLVCAFSVSSSGRAQKISLEDYNKCSPGDGYLWLHFDIRDDGARRWIAEESGIASLAKQTLLTEETRPHVWRQDDFLVMALRSVNLNPNADLEDMVAVRIYADRHKIITTRRRSLMSLREVSASMSEGSGPGSIAKLVEVLTSRVTGQLVETIDNLEDNMDSLEDAILRDTKGQRRVHVMELRRKCILLRRYLAPQREALAQLYREPVTWIDDAQRMQQRNIADQLVRYVESLDAVKDRAAVVQEELATRSADQLNTRMYLLSVVAALFLPLTFILSIFNLQFGGKPLTEHEFGLVGLGVMMLGTAFVQLALFKRKGWL